MRAPATGLSPEVTVPLTCEAGRNSTASGAAAPASIPGRRSVT